MTAVQVLSPLLIPFGTPTLMKAVERFVVADHFKVGNVVGGLKIRSVSNTFRWNFFDVVEKNIPERLLPAWTLAEFSHGLPILPELGGENARSTQIHLSHFFKTIELGKSGPGLLNGSVNIGYKVSLHDDEYYVLRWSVHNEEVDVDTLPAVWPVGICRGARVLGGA